jgi:uncharacterized protein (TIGR04222 family)
MLPGMAGFDAFNPWHLTALAGGWLALTIVAAALGWSGRRRARGGRLPPDAPADLDAYGLACLAGWTGRLREAGLAALVARGALRPRPAGAGATLGPELPPDAHPVEEALFEAMSRRPRDWLRASYEAAVLLGKGCREDLRRQDLLADPARGLGLLPAAMAWLLALAVSVLAIVAVARHPLARPGNTDPTGRTQGLVIAFGLGFAACGAGLTITMGPLYRNRRGDHVLAEALRSHVRLDPAAGPWSALTPADLAMAVGLFGLPRGIGGPLGDLWMALHPPSPPSGNG